jgi:hypothetical protein
VSLAALVVAFPMLISPMPVAFGPVPPFFPGFMLVVPMVPVSVIMTVPDKFLLRRLATEMVVVPAMLIIVQIRLRVIHHHFMTVIKIEIVITRRQFMRKCPMTPVKIDKLMVRYIVIGLDVRNVVIFYVIIPCRPPGRLGPDVYGKMDLCGTWI